MAALLVSRTVTALVQRSAEYVVHLVSEYLRSDDSKVSLNLGR